MTQRGRGDRYPIPAPALPDPDTPATEYPG